MEIFVKGKTKDYSGSHLTTVNTYVTVPDAVTGEDYFNVKGFKSKTMQLACATNDLQYSIDYSNDATNWFNWKTDQLISAGTVEAEEYNVLWKFIRVQVKPNVVDTHGTLTVTIHAGVF